MDNQDPSRFFLSALSEAPKASLVGLLDMVKEGEISYLMSMCPLQDPILFRARFFGLQVANLLIDEKGELQKKNLEFLTTEFKKGLFSLGPNRESDSLIFSHISRCLDELSGNNTIWGWIKKFSPPLSHKQAEEVVRETLYPEPVRKVETVHIRKATLASWLTWLRQATGSCFATAPAILIQKSQPQNFFKDLYDLLHLGQLKRVIEGKEYSVPFSPSLGGGDLDRPLIGKEALAYLPGLIFSLEAAGVIPGAIPMGNKIQLLEGLLRRVKERKSVRQIIYTILLDFFELNDEEIKAEEALSRIQINPMIGQGYFYQRPSERAEKISSLKKALEISHRAFWCQTESSLLRAWEYTLASFSDAKVDFARWNLYISLGLHPEQKGGIAEFLFQWIDERLQKFNKEAVQRHQEYEYAISAVRTAESLLRQAYSEAQQYRLKSELTSAVHAANLALNMRDEAQHKAEALSQFFSGLLEQVYLKLQDYFQEVFDPSPKGENEKVYEDSPAGFRLLYKHGRTRASTWSLIQNEKEFLEALRDFITTLEMDIQTPGPLDKDFISELVTALLGFIQDPDFLTLANERVKNAGRESPWHYISGGTMQTLVQAYYRLNKPVTEEKWLPKSNIELLDHLLKIKNISEEPHLMHSPTHAFLFRPDLLAVNAMEKLNENMRYSQEWIGDEAVLEFILHLISEKLFLEEKPLFLHLARTEVRGGSALEFRKTAWEALKKTRPQANIGMIDSILFEEWPFFEKKGAEAALRKILSKISVKYKIPWSLIEDKLSVKKSIMGSLELQSLAKAILLKVIKKPLVPADFDFEIQQVASSLGLAYPYPILFADTNWSDWYFGWIVNRATKQLELWRLNRTGRKGFPMTDWDQWISQENKTHWILLSKVQEYSDL